MSLLAVVDRRERLVVINATSENRSPLFEATGARWPVWVGGAQTIAHSTWQDGRPVVQLREVADSGAPPVTLYQNEPGIDAVLGPGMPHYIVPSADGAIVAVVAPSSEGMTVTFVRTANSEIVATVNGAPLFPVFSMDGEHAAVHAGGDLVVLDMASGARRDVVTADAMGFRAPAIGPGDELAYVARSGRRLALSWSTIDGLEWAPGPIFYGGAVASFRPGSRVLWLGSRPIGSSGLLSRLSVAPYGAPDRQRVYSGPFTAFSWSPSGRHLVLVVPRQPGDDRCALAVIDVDGQVLAESETFLPSDDQRALWSFFDQYAVSHSSWLRMGDEEFFVVSGRAGTDRVSPMFGSSEGNRVMLWRPSRAAPLVDVCPGEMAVPAPLRAAL